MCGMFLVAQIPFLQYSQYDAYVEVVNNYAADQSEHIPDNVLNTLHFKMAYFNPRFTQMQIGIRTAFILMTFGFTIWYLVTLCKGVPRHVISTHD